MKTLEIIGFKRANLNKKDLKALRMDGNVPCVMYGGKKQVQFHSPMILFRDLVYTPEVHMVDLNVEGEIYKCILQDIQFHPVSEMILHADFLELRDDKPVKMNIPISFTGTAPGIQQGGKLVQKLRTLSVKALPKDMPDDIKVDISKMKLGDSVKVKTVISEEYDILNDPRITIASVKVPRVLRVNEDGVAEDGEEDTEESAAEGEDTQEEVSE